MKPPLRHHVAFLQKWKKNDSPLNITVANGSWLLLIDCLHSFSLGFLRGLCNPGRSSWRYSGLSGDGFLAQSRDSRIDFVPLFNPLSSRYQDSQEACGYLISHFQIGKQLPNFAILMGWSLYQCAPSWCFTFNFIYTRRNTHRHTHLLLLFRYCWLQCKAVSDSYMPAAWCLNYTPKSDNYFIMTLLSLCSLCSYIILTWHFS